MVIYPTFCRWKTRRALLRGAALGALLVLSLCGLEQNVVASRWPEWLGRGDWGRAGAIGAVAGLVGLVDYGYLNRDGRAPWHMVLLVLLVAWAGLLLVGIAPSAGVVLQDPAALRDQWPVALSCLPAALVFAQLTRQRWQGKRVLKRFSAGILAATLCSIFGLVVLLWTPSPVAPFGVLVAVPVAFGVLLPVVSSLTDVVDGWVFQLPDDPTQAGEGSEVRQRVPRQDSSEQRVFSWRRAPDEDEGEEGGEANPESDPQREDPGSSDLDALANDLWT